MNPLALSEHLQAVPDAELQRMAIEGNGATPSYLVLAEIQRRRQLRNAAQAQQQRPPSVMSEIPSQLAQSAPPMQAPVRGFQEGGEVYPWDVSGQAAADREKVRKAWQMLTGGMEDFGRAIADVAVLPIRGVTGAYDTAVVRPLRAAGVPARYLSPFLVPEGVNPATMTPFYDARGVTPAPLDPEAVRLQPGAPRTSTVPVGQGVPGLNPEVLQPGAMGAMGAPQQSGAPSVGGGLRAAAATRTGLRVSAPTSQALFDPRRAAEFVQQYSKLVDTPEEPFKPRTTEQLLGELRQAMPEGEDPYAEIRKTLEKGKLSKAEIRNRTMLQVGLGLLTAKGNFGQALGAAGMQGVQAYSQMAEQERQLQGDLARYAAMSAKERRDFDRALRRDAVTMAEGDLREGRARADREAQERRATRRDAIGAYTTERRLQADREMQERRFQADERRAAAAMAKAMQPQAPMLSFADRNTIMSMREKLRELMVMNPDAYKAEYNTIKEQYPTDSALLLRGFPNPNEMTAQELANTGKRK